LFLLLTAAVLFAFAIVVFAIRSDKVGRRKIMLWGCGALVFWSAIFFPLVDTKSVSLAALAVCGMLVLQGAYVGPQAAVFSELFPTAVRYSGASLSITLGTLLGGAIAPFLATALFSATGNSWPITAYAVTVSLISWLCVLRLKETYQQRLTTPTELR
jgi:MFS family permease